jgi:hypothetical protein
LVCQNFTISMEVGLKWCTKTYCKILKSFLVKNEACSIFLVIQNTTETIESMRVVNFEIPLLPNCNCFLLQFLFPIVVYLEYYNFCVKSFGFCPLIFKVWCMEWIQMKHRLIFWSHCRWLTISLSVLGLVLHWCEIDDISQQEWSTWSSCQVDESVLHATRFTIIQ